MCNNFGVVTRGVDPGGDEGDASPPAIGVGGMDNTIIPPGFTIIIIIQTKK